MERGIRSHLAETLAHRFSYYDLLRRLFLWQLPLEVFAELVEAAKDEQPAASSGAHERALLKVMQQVPAGDIAAAYHEIQIEYTRLFLGPRHRPAPPYESVYRSPHKLMMQDVTMEVRAFYRKSGFQVALQDQEPDDSIGMELEFLCALSKQSMRALARQDDAALKTLIATQYQFCEKHLCRWVPEFCADIARGARSDFWRGIADCTQSFIAQDRADLNHLLNQLEMPAASEVVNGD